MSFIFENFSSTKGKLTRPQYFIYVILGFICYGVATVLLENEQLFSLLIGFLFGVLAVWFFVSGAVKRLKDASQNPWWLLLQFIPLVNIIFMLFLIFVPSGVSKKSPKSSKAKNSESTTSISPIRFILLILIIVPTVAFFTGMIMSLSKFSNNTSVPNQNIQAPNLQRSNIYRYSELDISNEVRSLKVELGVPLFLDFETYLFDITSSGRNIIYDYRFSGNTNGLTSASIKSSLLSGICSQIEIQDLLRDRINFVYRYELLQSGGSLTFTVNAFDCGLTYYTN